LHTFPIPKLWQAPTVTSKGYRRITNCKSHWTVIEHTDFMLRYNRTSVLLAQCWKEKMLNARLYNQACSRAYWRSGMQHVLKCTAMLQK